MKEGKRKRRHILTSKHGKEGGNQNQRRDCAKWKRDQHGEWGDIIVSPPVLNLSQINRQLREKRNKEWKQIKYT